MWDQFKEGLTAFTNNPVVISIVSILTIVVGALLVLSRTSLGKAAIKLLTSKFGDLSDKFNSHKKEVQEQIEAFKEAKDDLFNECQEFEKNVQNQVVAVYSQFEILESDLFAALEQIPNAKVQAKIKEIRETSLQKTTEVRELLGDTYGTIQKKINEEVEKRTKESKEEIATLKSEIEILKELVNKTLNEPQTGDLTPQTEETEEADNGKAEETPNN